MLYQTRDMVALKPMRHQRRDLSPGDVFAATDADARYLERVKLAAPHIESPAVAESDPAQDEQTMPSTDVPQVARKRTYTRRQPRKIEPSEDEA